MRKVLINSLFIDMDQVVFASLRDPKTVRIIFAGNEVPIHIECNTEDEANDFYQKLINASKPKEMQ